MRPKYLELYRTWFFRAKACRSQSSQSHDALRALGAKNARIPGNDGNFRQHDGSRSHRVKDYARKGASVFASEIDVRLLKRGSKVVMVSRLRTARVSLLQQ